MAQDIEQELDAPIIEDSDGNSSSAIGDHTVVDDIVAADPEFTHFDDASLSAALSGKTVISNGDKIVLNFRKSTAGAPLPYTGEIDGKIVFFDKNGVSRDGTVKLSLAASVVQNTSAQGEEQTRGDDTFVMNSLNFKEQVALRVLAAIVKHEANPLAYDDSKIKLLVAMAFRVAVEFQNRAIEFRKAESGGGGGSGGVDVDVDSLANNTEKLLYNMSEYMKNGMAIKGSAELGAAAISTKITEMPKVIIPQLEIPTAQDAITIKVSILSTKYLRFRFTSEMAYSDISVYVECNVKEDTVTATRKVGCVLRKGSVVVVEELDPAVTEITSIASVEKRGQGTTDGNTYFVSTE